MTVPICTIKLGSLGGVAVNQGNAYVLDRVSRIRRAPGGDSSFFFADETVPFYQMVLHGIVPYTTDPGNIGPDFAGQKLKWVEFGSEPVFLLTRYPKGENASARSLWLGKDRSFSCL